MTTTTPISVLPGERSTRSISEFEFFNEPTVDSTTRLGKGSFASVHLAKEKKTGSLVAIKIINVNLSSASKSDIHNLQTEIKVHRELNHPNIIKFHDYIQEGLNIYMILDYAPNGNLYSYMNKKRTLSADQVFRFFHQACLAIQYLHQKDILHRDLKPENLLLDKELNLKLCDFGWAARSIRDKRTTFCGTYEYMAPEIVEKRPYDYRVDIWSLGVLLYELSHGEAPYKGRSLPEITTSLAKGSFQCKSTIAPELKDLIHKILRITPTERISLSEILSHTWVRKNLLQSGYNTNSISSSSNSTKSLENLRNLSRTQRLPIENYNDSIDKENLQMKELYSSKPVYNSNTPKDEVTRALINLGHVPETLNDAKRRIERADTLPGVLAYREMNQGRALMEVNSATIKTTTDREFNIRKQSEYPSLALAKTYSEKDTHSGMDVFTEYSRRPKYMDRSAASLNIRPQQQQSENDPNSISQNTTFEKSDSSNMKTFNHQRTIELLKKAQSSRAYYVKPNFLEKSLSQQPVPRENQYSSNPNTYNPTPVGLGGDNNNKANYVTQSRQRPLPLSYGLKAMGAQYNPDYNNNEEEMQWKRQNFTLKTEAVKMGNERMYTYETQGSNLNRSGYGALKSYSMNNNAFTLKHEGDSRSNYSPMYTSNQNMGSGQWQQNVLNLQPVSNGTPSSLLLK